MEFSLESFYNQNLASGAKRVDIVVTINAKGEVEFGSQRGGGDSIVGFVIDVSGSMNDDNKLEIGKHALRCCISLLKAPTRFFVVTFNEHAKVIVPLCVASRENIEAAHQAIQRLTPGGGTCMSTGLEAARQEIAKGGGAMAFVQYLTDGENDGSDSKRIVSVIEACKGKFQCDGWGLGTDWRPDQLRLISNSLLGSADAVPNAKDLEARFNGALAKALSKGIGGVRLRLQMPKTSKLIGAKQMSPEIADLMKLSKQVDDRNIDLPLGAWGEESRDYHLVFELQSQIDGEEMMACRPKIVYDENGTEVVKTFSTVMVTWSADEALTTRINQQVAHYTGQAELAESIKEGLEAKARGDVDQATVLLGKAAKIAAESGNDEVTRRLSKVVDVIDAGEGTVRLKSGRTREEDKAATLELDMGMTQTVRISRNNSGASA